MRTGVIVLGVFLMLAMTTVQFPRIGGGLLICTADAAEQGSVGKMQQIHLILKKLQDAMTSMKDFDELEKSGMPRKSVNRMRRAMQLKIDQMMEEAIADIRSL